MELQRFVSGEMFEQVALEGYLETLMLYVVMALVDDQAAIHVRALPGEGSAITIRVTVSPADLGKVIGKQGRTARSLRTILGAAGQKHKRIFVLDIQGAK